MACKLIDNKFFITSPSETKDLTFYENCKYLCLSKKIIKSITVLFFLCLILAFVLSYLAITKYPGKTIETVGFQLASDYWCDLYKRQTPSGKLNHGMLPAKLATIAGAFSFICFWIAIPWHIITYKTKRILTQSLGVSALLVGSFVFTSFHDYAIVIGTLLGFFAISLLIQSLRQCGKKKMAVYGIVVILLLIMCNVIMFLPFSDFVLPILQKISFGSTIIWTLMIAWPIMKE